MIPIEQKLETTTARFNEIQAVYQSKIDELNKVKEHIARLKSDYEETRIHINRLNDTIQTNKEKLGRAKQLIELTIEEGENWKVTVASLKEDMVRVVGDIFLATATISYAGPFTKVFRDKITAQWIAKLGEYKISCSDRYQLKNTLGNSLEIRNWTIKGLPSDTVSIDNGIMTVRSQRWPLMIDPQTQANQWIRNMHPENLRVIKLSETTTYPKVLDSALKLGHVVLIEDVLEEIDPALDNILQKAIFMNDGLPCINFGDKDINYDDNFKLFITSKLPNPHYLPEVCIKMTIINFTVTFEGLEEQMLADVVILEDPEAEAKRDRLVLALADLEMDKRNVEIKILKTLAESNEETILDGNELIDILESSKIKAVKIKEQLEDSIKTETEVTEKRNQYKEVAVRGAILYFVITDLAIIDSMYQYSLDYVKKLYNEAIKDSKPSDDIDERLAILIESITRSIYKNICRGLFESHKMIYSFLICTSIQRNKKAIGKQSAHA